jgi:protoporphyrinogen/coproporphyrinogen III oxidase
MDSSDPSDGVAPEISPGNRTTARTGTRVAIIGGGITGLAAGWEAVAHGLVPTIFEASERLGGKVLTRTMGGHRIDAGPDAFLARVPDATALCHELGLGDELVAPASSGAYVYVRGALRPLPAELVLGVPRDLKALARSGLVSWPGMARAALEPLIGRRRVRAIDPSSTYGDSIGVHVAARFGHEVAESVVDPLLGGISAGHIDRLSMEAMAPQLHAIRDDRSALLTFAGQPRPPAGPVFLTVRSGLGTMIDRLGSALSDHIRLNTSVNSVAKASNGASGWMVNGELFDAIVLASGAVDSARLLAPINPHAAGILGAIPHASVGLVTLRYRRELVRPLEASGYLVARRDRHVITAVSWGSSKWPHWGGDDEVVLRVSVGSVDDPMVLAGTDDQIVAAVLRDLTRTMGLSVDPIEAQLTRWPAAFAQYLPGHVARVAELRRALAGSQLMVAGSAVDGVGLPACIRSGRAAISQFCAL